MKWATKIISFHGGDQIGVYRGDTLICVADWKDGKASNVEFDDPSYQKCNKTRQKAIKMLVEASR